MKLLTSHFGVERRIPTEYFTISIARKLPYYSGVDELMPLLAPTWDMISGYHNSGDEAAYTKAYNEEILGRLDPHKVWKSLETHGMETVVLLCYERPGLFCHRQLVAKWFRDAGYEVEEFVPEN